MLVVYVTEAIKTISKLFTFSFYINRFHTQKNTHKQKQTNKTKISEQKTTKAAVFCAQRLLRGRNRFCWVWYFLCVWSLFEKKINRFKIVLTASMTCTTYMGVSWGKKCLGIFSENLRYFVFLLPPFWDSRSCLITNNIMAQN